MDDEKIHLTILKSLSDEGIITVTQDAVLSCMGIQPYHNHNNIPVSSSLPVEVERAVSALLLLKRSLDQHNDIFEAALQSSRTAWKVLEDSLEVAEGYLNSENVAAALFYCDNLAKFRALWSILFGTTYPLTSPREVPPHMFAVHWSQVRSPDVIEWIHKAHEDAQRTLYTIHSGEAPKFSYFLFVLQRTLGVQAILLECIAEIFENSAFHIDVMVVVRYMYTAYSSQKEMKKLYSVWDQIGLLTNISLNKCSNYSQSEFNTCTDLADAYYYMDEMLWGLAKTHAVLPTHCHFLCILQCLIWCLYGRLSLLFSSCFISLPRGTALLDESPIGDISRGNNSNIFTTTITTTTTNSSITISTNMSAVPLLPVPPYYFDYNDNSNNNNNVNSDERFFLHTCGCRSLAEVLWDATHTHRGATLCVITDCTKRPGRRAWRSNKYTLLKSLDNAATRQGIEHWVLNFVFPNSRLATEATLRGKQEMMLLHAVVFQAAGSMERRLRFTNGGYVFHVIRSDSEMDGGRMYFVLLLQEQQHQQQEETLFPHLNDCRSGNNSDEKSSWAFRSLEEVCAAWSMPQLCNAAVRLAAWDA